jgi:hypothetical protein
MKQIKQIVKYAFAKGLTATFAGKSNFEKITRGSFPMISSVPPDMSYIDQWLPDQSGGGQEILEVDGIRYTRVYAGGTVEEKILLTLGISKSDVMVFLTKVLTSSALKTRLDESFHLEDGEWSYSYDTTVEDLAMITGKEVISYKNTQVFVHLFIICIVTP